MLTRSLQNVVASGMCLALMMTFAGCEKVQEMIPQQTATEAPETPVPENVPATEPAPAEMPAPVVRTPQQIIAEFIALPQHEKTDERLIELTSLAEGLDAITELDLSLSKVTDAGCEGLGKLAQLESLNLSKTIVTKATIDRLPVLPLLRSLDLASAPRIDGTCLESIGKLESLQELSLQETLVDDISLQHVGPLPHLEVLRLDGVRNLTGKPFAIQVQKGEFKELKELSFSGSQFGIYALENIAKMPKLEILRASGSDIGDGSLQGIQACQNLRILDVSHNNLTPRAVQQFPRLKKLEVLRLDGCTGIIDVALNQIRLLTQLKELGLENAGVTPGAVEKLKSEYLKQTTIYYGGKTL
ncbi:MAG: hypothetical protein KDA58_03740 [Planctomycetaceae bacterium]|nr:hypothetical protein [Planctomycetaceae bacterium]